MFVKLRIVRQSCRVRKRSLRSLDCRTVGVKTGETWGVDVKALTTSQHRFVSTLNDGSQHLLTCYDACKKGGVQFPLRTRCLLTSGREAVKDGYCRE